MGTQPERALARRVGFAGLLAVGLLGLSACRGAASLRPVRLAGEGADPLSITPELSAPDPRIPFNRARTREVRSEVHRRAGERALRRGELEAARRSFFLGLALDPGNPAAHQGHLEVRAELARLGGARELLLEGIALERWDDAFLAASLIPSGALPMRESLDLPDLRLPPSPAAAPALFEHLRERVWSGLRREVLEAVRTRSRQALADRICEGESILARGWCEETIPAPDLIAELELWQELLATGPGAEDLGHDPLWAWRHYRIARNQRPHAPGIVATEIELRARGRSGAVDALGAALASCELRDARSALDILDELGDGWPSEAPASRAEVEAWIVAGAIRSAREAERRGYLGTALLHWLSANAGDSGEAIDLERRIGRLRDRMMSRTSVRIREFSEPSFSVRAPETLEAILLPMRIEQSVERTRAVEPVGWERTGVTERANRWHATAAKRWHECVLTTIELRDSWLRARPTRAALRERRLRFHLREVARIAKRLHSLGATEECGVWRAREIGFELETREIRVLQPIQLLRGGRRVGEITVAVEERLRGRVPDAGQPGASDALPLGEASYERLRLRLIAECRRRVPIELDSLRRSEWVRGLRHALDLHRRGEVEEAIETMATTWLLSKRVEPRLHERAAAHLSRWTEIPPEELDLGP